MQKQKIVIGVDEVGRGALAGPVVVAGIAVEPPFRWQYRVRGTLRDSKKLTALRREAWFRYFTGHPKIQWAVARVTPKVIDRINISRAANLASLRVVKKLSAEHPRYFVYLDGGLVLPDSIPHRSVIKGDEKIKVISASSIIAKVVRDRAMIRLHKKDPRYRFDIHKGYGTMLHRALMHHYGYSDRHRKTFVLK